MDNLKILKTGPINFDFFTYMSNIDLKKRLATRTTTDGFYELYDSVNGHVVMSGTMNLDKYLYADN